MSNSRYARLFSSVDSTEIESNRLPIVPVLSSAAKAFPRRDQGFCRRLESLDVHLESALLVPEAVRLVRCLLPGVPGAGDLLEDAINSLAR